MNEQLLKDFIATAQKYNYNWNKAFGLFPELKGYDQQLLKDYVATAEKNNYDYKKVNSLFPEFGFNQEPVKKKESTVSASKLEKPTSGSSSRRFEGVTEEPISQKKVRTEDYLDQVQNIQKKPKATTQKVESTFEQPKETKPPVKFDTLSDKEAMQMMAEDFGKKEFEAYSSINEIPSSKKLRDLDEETTANILNKQFEGTNLEFKKLGWQLTVTSKIGDGINSTILNQETIDLSDPNADKELKSFVSTNLVKKSEREQFENAQSVEDLVELVGSNPNKFKASLLEGMDVDSYFERERQLLNGEMTRAKADTYNSDLKSYEQKVAKFNQDVKGGKMSKADFDARSSELENERNSLTQRRDIMSSVIRKAEKIDKLTNNLEDAKVITAAEREKQGSLTGLVLRGVGEGLTDVSQAMIDFGIAGAAAVTDAKTLADAITPGEYERLKELGFSDDEIKNEIQKSVKNKANQVLRSVPDAFGMGTTEEYAKSTDRGVIEQAAFAIGESLGAVGGGLATAGTNAGFFAMSYNALEDQMRGPQFDALSENEKKIMSVPYGLVIGALEKLGAKVATGAAKNKTLGMFSEYIMSKTFSSLPKNASLLEIKSAIDKSVAASVANGMLKITGAGIVEGGTEFTQQIFEGVEKDIANRIIQSNQLDKAKEEGGGTVSKEIYNQIVQNKFFKDAADLSTTEGIGQLLKESGNAFLVGAVAGGMGSTASVGVVEPISNKVSNNRFAVYRDIILNDDAREGAISSINKKVEDNQITREQADEEIKSINEAYPALRQIPTNFSVGAQREAFGLLMERESLDKEIKDKDPNLVAKQKDRVDEINEQLKGLSYAVQEQGTDAVPVQSGAGVSQQMEEGKPATEPQVVTGETITEEVEVEGPKAEQPQAEVAQEEVVEKLTVNPLEGYSFEYESENDIPAELKGVEPTGRTETKVGRGKNAKTNLKLTFTGQQLIDAGLAATPESQTEVVQETVQPTVQAAPTAKIETIEVQEVPQVEQTLDDLTQQNNVLTQNDFTAAKIRNVGKEKIVAQITRAAKAISKVLPKVKIVVHATPEAFVEATKDMDGRLSEGGLYDRKTGQIHINLEKATNRTVPHEVFHALILSRVNTDVEAGKLTRSMINSVRKSLKKAEGTAELMSYLEDFESNYDENIKNEEKLAELFAILADNYKQLPPASKNIIVRFLNRLAKAIGLKEMTDREAIQFMNTLSRKVETGQEIEAREVGQQKEGDAAVRKQKTTSPDKIVDDGIKAGKTDADIRQEGKAAGFTNKEMTEALSKYYTKEQKVFMKSGVKGLVGRFVDGAKKFKQKFLTSKGLLPKIGFTYKEKMEGEISAEANRAAKTAKKFGVLFDKFTGDKELLLKAFDKALRGDKSIQLPAGFAALANEMRNHIDRLSQMLITTGAVEGDMADAIRENMGSYITRSYEIFDNKNFRQKVGEQELQAAKNFLRTEPGMISLAKAEAARTGTTINEALDILVDNKIDEYFADAETGALVKGAKLGSKDLSTLKERKEIPEQIRMLMGEYSDPAMNYARTVLNISSLVARHQFLTQVKEAGMGKFFFEKNDSQRPKGFDTEIASEGSDTMSPLNGLMTTPEIAEAFDLYNGKQGEDHWAQQAIKVYYKAMGLVKWLKTIGSVATHAKNIFSNLGFVAVNGHSLIEIGKAIKVVAQDLKTMSKPEVEAKIDEYIKAGIMRQGAGINEIRDMFKDADMDGFLERRLSMKKRKGVMGKIRQAISSRSSKIISAMEDAYQAEDDMFKIAAYETEMNRYADALYNKSKDQLTDKEKQEVSDIAANNVKNTYPTYSRIPEGIKRLRRFPLFIGSFISFQAESYRTAYNTIALAKDELSSKNKKIKKIGARRVAGASSYLTAKTAMLSYLGYAAGTGIGGALGALFDDDDEKKKEKDVRSFLPPWSQNSDLIILKAADGQIEYIDFSASDPHGGINKALNAFLKGDDLLDSFKQSTLELVGQFQGPDILTNLAIQLKGNENDFGKPIYNEEDSFSEKADKILDYVYKVVEPGTITSIRKASASEQSLGQIAFGDATGLKIRKSDVKEQFGYKLAEFDESFKDIRKIYNSEYYKSIDIQEDPNATKKDIQEQNKKTEESLIRANEKYAAKAKELMDLINSANRLGVDYDELINELRFIKSTMGKSNISEMENGGDEFIKEKED